MIIIKQAIMARVGKHKMLIPTGTYNKVPKLLAADKDFLHYVNNGIIEGYEMTEEEKKNYKPLVKPETVRSVKKYDPETDDNIKIEEEKDEIEITLDSLAEMNLPDLKAYAKANELEIKGLNKPEILELCQSHLKAALEVNKTDNDDEGEKDLTPEELAKLEEAKRKAAENDNAV